jgi:hypothetical protein
VQLNLDVNLMWRLPAEHGMKTTVAYDLLENELEVPKIRTTYIAMILGQYIK